MENETPQHQHDCDRCQFLGRFEFDGPLSDGTTEHFKSDLYVCPEQVLGPSLIGRFSDDGPDYVSSPMEIVVQHEARMRAEPATHTPALIEALERYRARKA